MTYAALIASAGAALYQSQPVTADADTILGAFRAVVGLQAHFREEKRLAILAAPLVTEGEIYFAPPSRLAKRVTAPEPSMMLVDGKTLSFRDARGGQTLSLEAYPVARLFVDGFMQILSGDTKALHDLYEIAAEARPGGTWGLRLTPRAPPLSGIVAAIVVTGRGAVIDTLRVVETGGDVTSTRFSAVDTSRRFSADEMRRIFSTDLR
jgi:hypothetical protein